MLEGLWSGYNDLRRGLVAYAKLREQQKMAGTEPDHEGPRRRTRLGRVWPVGGSTIRHMEPV